MRIHALNTAQLGVKNSYYAAKGRFRILRTLSVVADPRFRTPLPVYTWAIEHPEGVIVIDTGESAQVNEAGFFPAVEHPYWRSQFRFYVKPEDEIGPQLRTRGIAPESVRWVIMTHTHFDHSDGIYHFPNADFIFSRQEYHDTIKYQSAHFAFPTHWPKWLRPHVIDYLPESIGPFDYSYPLTHAGDVRIVPTPGHTRGHQSVILRDGSDTYFFGGDTSFELRSLRNGTIDAPAVNTDQVLRTRQRILDYARDTPLIYLTTHDDQTETRLQHKIAI